MCVFARESVFNREFEMRGLVGVSVLYGGHLAGTPEDSNYICYGAEKRSGEFTPKFGGRNTYSIQVGSRY